MVFTVSIANLLIARVVRGEFKSHPTQEFMGLRARGGHIVDTLKKDQVDTLHRLAEQFPAVMDGLTSKRVLQWIHEGNPEVARLLTSTTDWWEWYEAECQVFRERVMSTTP